MQMMHQTRMDVAFVRLVVVFAAIVATIVTGRQLLHVRILAAKNRRIRDFAVFASSLDALVAVFVQTGKVCPETAVVWRHRVRVDIGEPQCQISEGCCVEFVLMGLYPNQPECMKKKKKKKKRFR
jgi:hypothetical protein